MNGEEDEIERAPIWTPDVEVTSCPFCDEKFTVFFRRVYFSILLIGSIIAGNVEVWHVVTVPRTK